MTIITDDELEAAPFEELLAAERARIVASLGELEAERRMLVSGIESGGEEDLDGDGGEGSTRSAELSRLEVLQVRLEERRDEVEAALRRLADGSYGICRSCGGPIGAARLEAVPEVTECVRCKQAPAWARRSLGVTGPQGAVNRRLHEAGV